MALVDGNKLVINVPQSDNPAQVSGPTVEGAQSVNYNDASVFEGSDVTWNDVGTILLDNQIDESELEIWNAFLEAADNEDKPPQKKGFLSKLFGR